MTSQNIIEYSTQIIVYGTLNKLFDMVYPLRSTPFEKTNPLLEFPFLCLNVTVTKEMFNGDDNDYYSKYKSSKMSKMSKFLKYLKCTILATISISAIKYNLSYYFKK